MRARLLQHEDKPRVLEMLGAQHGVQLDTDIVIVAENEAQRLVGLVAARNVYMVHEFRTDAGLNSRLVAEVLMNTTLALAQCKTVNHSARPEALFIISPKNERMRRFAVGFGAVQEDPGDVFTLRV